MGVVNERYSPTAFVRRKFEELLKLPDLFNAYGAPIGRDDLKIGMIQRFNTFADFASAMRILHRRWAIEQTGKSDSYHFLAYPLYSRKQI